MKNAIGIEVEKAKQLSQGLNDLLANYQIFYQNLRGLHWNVKGKEFFELHLKFEELYNDAILKVDEIAERILTLGGTPLHTMTDYINNSEIKEINNVSDGPAGVQHVINNFSVLIGKERALLSLSADADDEGTNSLMSDYISQSEKLVWMLTSYLG
ncbi:DNA starvation/stationary phase protection protein [Paracrocinitomix mangrovi]|uniref:Dps family protein n=1 Tax=Paracrocinitomix mangrovi TaxID=2862509 RepID=UPI001C8D4509|nr:Dps family protein [Paracrocinitomix mangrovi]UKN03813.1 DNA starvation/stationary phase protection protein [Paracrocinitomix mangrovi]